MPNRVAELLERSIRTGPLWRLHLTPTVHANCHFAADEIEFDLDPREIASQEAFDAVCAFMQAIGRALDRPVGVGIEGFPGGRPPDDMRYQPATDQVVAVSRT